MKNLKLQKLNKEESRLIKFGVNYSFLVYGVIM